MDKTRRGRPRKAPEQLAPRRSGPSGRPTPATEEEIAEYTRLRDQVVAAVEARGEGYGAGRRATLADIARLSGIARGVLGRGREQQGLRAMRRAHELIVG